VGRAVFASYRCPAWATRQRQRQTLGYNFRALRQQPHEQLFGNLQYDLSPPVRRAAEHLVGGTRIFQWQHGSNLWGQLSAIKQGRNRIQTPSCYLNNAQREASVGP
jgi:hypothetical protein